MRILADENMPYVAELFGGWGEIITRPGRAISAADVANADLLLVRSVTRVDAELLAAARQLKFVGSATIGCDHIDQALLAQRGIPFANAPGCNAPAVVDYVIASLFYAAQRSGRELQQLCYGVVGVGQCGGRLVARLRALGVEVLCCDPPRQQAEGLSDFVDIDTLIDRCDVISLHVPLLRSGPDATHHLLNGTRLARLRPDALLINACRGEVVDNHALLGLLHQRPDVDVILDVWEGEPEPLPPLVARALIATPHIAGYSLEGKARGSWMLAERVAALLQLPVPPALVNLLPPPQLSQLQLAVIPDWAQLGQLVHAVYQPLADDTRMRQSGLEAAGFDRLRRDYPQRRELAATCVSAPAAAHRLLTGCGFTLNSPVEEQP